MINYKDFVVGDLVYLKRKPVTYYKWHLEYPNVRFIGLVIDKIDGWSYSIAYIKIIYPEKGKEYWK